MENVLPEETAKICEGIMSIDECKQVLMMMERNKTPGTDGLTPEFYRYFWNTVSKFLVESFQHLSMTRHYFFNPKKE